MGLALASAARRRGADVTLLAANVSLPEPAGVRRVDVETVADLAEAVRNEAADSDLVLMAAAVSDFSPTQMQSGKLSREETETLSLSLEPTEDILAALADRRQPSQTLVGFAAESGGDVIARAREKLAKKNVDAVVVNDVSDAEIGFDSEENEVTIVTEDAAHHLERAEKSVVAEQICDHVDQLIGKRVQLPS